MWGEHHCENDEVSKEIDGLEEVDAEEKVKPQRKRRVPLEDDRITVVHISFFRSSPTTTETTPFLYGFKNEAIKASACEAYGCIFTLSRPTTQASGGADAFKL